MSLSAAALKGGVVGLALAVWWTINRIANDSRFLNLPGWQRPNIRSRVQCVLSTSLRMPVPIRILFILAVACLATIRNGRNDN